jgi:hypothetical protein
VIWGIPDARAALTFCGIFLSPNLIQTILGIAYHSVSFLKLLTMHEERGRLIEAF